MQGQISGEGVGGVHPPPPEMNCGFFNTTGILQKTKKTRWFIGVEVEQETSAPPPKKILDLPLLWFQKSKNLGPTLYYSKFTIYSCSHLILSR